MGYGARVRLRGLEKAVVLDAPPKWAPCLMNAARDRALAPVFVSEGVKSTFGLRKRVKGATIERRRGRDAEPCSSATTAQSSSSSRPD